MAKDVKLHKVEAKDADPNRRTTFDVVFIHGLTGHYEKTWRPSNSEIGWPDRVANAHPEAQVWALSYPAAAVTLWDFGGGDQPDTETLAVLATERMRNQQIGERPCIFVCHSLGGLIAKCILLNASTVSKREQRRFQHENVKAVMFCGTPHRGAVIASVATKLERYADSISGLKQLLSTSTLIQELEKNKLELQLLNEDFRSYYETRAGKDFLVSVYAETEKLLGALVVPADSANPNLRIGSAPPLQVLPVPGKDHIALVKPVGDSDWVVEGLNDLIRCVRQEVFEFGLEDGLQKRVGMLIHAEFFKCSQLLNLSHFRKLADSQPDPGNANFHIARQLASAEEDAVIESMGQLLNAFDEIPRAAADSKALHDGLTRIGCTLLLAYMRTDAARSPVAQEALKIEVPNIEDPEQLDIMVEVLHASLRNWPVKLKLSEDQACLRPGSRVLSSAALAPKSWRWQDHLHHLVNRILAAKTMPDSARSGVYSVEWPVEDAPTIGPVDDLRLLQARGILKAWLAQQTGLVLHALDKESPYGKDGMRERIDEAFGDLIALVLPEPETESSKEKNSLSNILEKLAFLQGFAQQFFLKSESARP